MIALANSRINWHNTQQIENQGMRLETSIVVSESVMFSVLS